MNQETESPIANRMDLIVESGLVFLRDHEAVEIGRCHLVWTPDHIENFPLDEVPASAPKPSELTDAPKLQAADTGSWLYRLNAALEAWMERVDWPVVELRIGTVLGCGLTGFILWFCYTVAKAFLSGAFATAVR